MLNGLIVEQQELQKIVLSTKSDIMIDFLTAM